MFDVSGGMISGRYTWDKRSSLDPVQLSIDDITVHTCGTELPSYLFCDQPFSDSNPLPVISSICCHFRDY